jgi:hypothetical protein
MVARAPIGRGRDLPLPAPSPAPRRPSAAERQRTGSTPADRSATRGEVVRSIAAIGRGFRVALEVPGRHYSGLTYDELLAILADQGRDFAATTTAMRRAVLAEVTARFENTRRAPTDAAIRDALAEAALAWIVRRFAGKVRDEHLRALTIPYARRKAKDGYGGEPIGTRTGALAARVADYGRVTLT